MKPEGEALKFVEVVPDDTYNGYLILKRGSVVVNESLIGAGEVRQLILCGNQTLMILRTPSQLFKCLDEEQIEDLKSRQHPFYLENVDLLAKLQEGIDEEEEANTRFTIFGSKATNK